jgi:hypothetical protein
MYNQNSDVDLDIDQISPQQLRDIHRVWEQKYRNDNEMKFYGASVASAATNDNNVNKIPSKNTVKKTYNLMSMFSGGQKINTDEETLEDKARRFEKLENERQAMQLYAASVEQKSRQTHPYQIKKSYDLMSSPENIRR